MINGNGVNGSNNRKHIGLALGGGAARGLAHIGVLAVLEEADIPIDFIAGTSMGSLVGSAYCAGISVAELREIAATTGWQHICRPTWPRNGLVSFAAMEEWIINTVGDLDIRDLAIPFAAVAADLESSERVILTEGPLHRAVRASCSVPGFATPVEVNGRLLCDGGVVDNLPDFAARQLGADYVIGVDVFVPAYRTYLGPLGVTMAAVEMLVQKAGGGDIHADCLIIPDLVDKSYIRLSDYRAFIEAGEQATRIMLPAILDAITAPTFPPPLQNHPSSSSISIIT